MENGLYTFETLEDLEVKHIKPLQGGIGNLVDSQHLTSYPNAPKYDHTTRTGGYFLFMNQKSDQNTSYETELIINNLPKVDIKTVNKEKCIAFAYQAVGNAKLQVYFENFNSSSHFSPIFETSS